MRIRNPLVGTLAAVAGWVVLFFTVSHWWALATANEVVVGTAGLLAGEVIRTAPTLGYFFVTGLIFGRTIGAGAGARWASLAAAVSMAVYALLAQQIFYDGFDVLAVALLAVDYLIPIILAISGAALAGMWGRPPNGPIAT